MELLFLYSSIHTTIHTTVSRCGRMTRKSQFDTDGTRAPESQNDLDLTYISQFFLIRSNSVYDVGPTVNQRLANVSCYLGGRD